MKNLKTPTAASVKDDDSVMPSGARTRDDDSMQRWIKQTISNQIASGRPGGEILDWLKATSYEIPQFIQGKSANDLMAWMKSDPILSGASGCPRFEQTIEEMAGGQK